MTLISRRKSWIFILVVLFLGSVLGSMLGRVLAWLLPDNSVVEKFFLLSVQWGIKTFTLEAGLFNMTFGLTFELNIIGVLGIFFAAYILKYYL